MKLFHDTRAELRRAIDEQVRLRLTTSLDERDAELRRLGEEFRREDRRQRATGARGTTAATEQPRPSSSNERSSKGASEAPVPPPALATDPGCEVESCPNRATTVVRTVLGLERLCDRHADEFREEAVA